MAIEMKFINNVHPLLSPWIKNYWVAEGKVEKKRSFKIIPMLTINMNILLEGKFRYRDTYEPEKVFVTNVKLHHLEVQQLEKSKTFGITFYPWGLIPFSQVPITELVDEVTSVKVIHSALYDELNTVTIDTSLEAIESILLQHLKVNESITISLKRIMNFIEQDLSVTAFASQAQISRKTLERDFKMLIGITPNQYKQIEKFEYVSRELLSEEGIKLSELALDGAYYDQAHLNRFFKQMVDESPKQFVQNKSALKSKINFKKN